MGKPDEPKVEPAPFRRFLVDLTDLDCPEEIPANYIRWNDGLISFWEDRKGEPHDHLVVAYPIHRIKLIEEYAE